MVAYVKKNKREGGVSYSRNLGKGGLGRQGTIFAEHFGRRQDNETSRDFYLQVKICRPFVIYFMVFDRFELIVIWILGNWLHTLSVGFVWLQIFSVGFRRPTFSQLQSFKKKQVVTNFCFSENVVSCGVVFESIYNWTDTTLCRGSPFRALKICTHFSFSNTSISTAQGEDWFLHDWLRSFKFCHCFVVVSSQNCSSLLLR